MRAVDADIWALQEVWEDGDRNQARELAAALGYDQRRVRSQSRTRRRARGERGRVALADQRRTKCACSRARSGDARDDEGEERLVVFAEIDGPRGPIQIYCTHFSWRDDHSAVRQAQVAEICRFVREHRPRSFPAVLCGDLNSDPTSDEVRMLTGQAAVPVPGVMFRDAWLAAGNYGTGRDRVEREPVQRGRARPRSAHRLRPRRHAEARRRRARARARGSRATRRSTACGRRTTSRSWPSSATDRADRASTTSSTSLRVVRTVGAEIVGHGVTPGPATCSAVSIVQFTSARLHCRPAWRRISVAASSKLTRRRYGRVR